jgi:hypothetical protein
MSVETGSAGARRRGVVEGRGDGEQVTVVDRALLDLGDELSENIYPGKLPGFRR